MTETIQVGDLSIELTRKDVKHVHLSVHPPSGHVTLVAPSTTRMSVARAYAISKLDWIRKQQYQFRAQARVDEPEYVSRESHFVWGRRYLLTVEEREARPSVRLEHQRLVLTVRPGSDQEKRASVIHAWHKQMLHIEVPGLIKTWEPRLDVKVDAYFLRRMKTKWGSCNPVARNIRLNTELVKKPKDLLTYVVVHEMLHLRVPNHSTKFSELLDVHQPRWRELRAELNELPLVEMRG